MNKGYKFNSPRYVTRGINETIPLSIQLFIWECIDKLVDEITLDYLQIFKLSSDNIEDKIVEKIIHTQEEFFPFSKEHIIPVSSPVTDTIYVVDDIDHVTMLLANEY